MSERRLSELARHLVVPDGIVGSDFNLVNRAAARIGIRYDLWQQGFLYLLLARKADGRYACGTAGGVVSSCRQIGKTFTVGSAILLLAAARPLKVIWTAHHTRTSDETFASLCSLAERPKLKPYVAGIRRANGQQEIRLGNGSRIMFGARESGFGRGLTGVDMEIFDEAQILTVRALSNLVPITNTSPNPLIVFMGNPPKPGDPSDAFEEKRTRALSAGGVLYVEFSADRDADPDDRAQWAKANPSYPERTDEDAILRMRENLPTDAFRREALGIWDETATSVAIDPAKWAAVESMPENLPDGGTLNFGLDMPPDRSVLTIGCAIRYPDGRALVQMADIKDARHDGLQWAVDWLAERWLKTASVVIDSQSPATSLLPDLKRAHVRATVTGMNEMGRACGRFMDMLNDKTLIHLPDTMQPQLAAAVKGATIRPIGRSGAFGWNKLGSDVDISPLVACTLALWGACTTKRHPGRKQEVMF